jgi:hypothetical protein
MPSPARSFGWILHISRDSRERVAICRRGLSLYYNLRRKLRREWEELAGKLVTLATPPLGLYRRLLDSRMRDKAAVILA